MNMNNRELLQQLFQLTWMLRRYTMHHHRERGSSPFQGQGRILALLKIKPEISQKELSTILDIRSQSLGELLAKLEKAGHITRIPSETDRRGMDIRLTDMGKTAADQAAPTEEDQFFDCLNAEEQAAFADFVERLIQSLETRIGAEPTEEGFGPGPGRGHGHGHRGPPGEWGFGPRGDRH